VVERVVAERERQRIGLQQRRLDAGPLQVPPREVELLRLDVDADQAACSTSRCCSGVA
jgi:hypothetical protein